MATLRPGGLARGGRTEFCQPVRARDIFPGRDASVQARPCPRHPLPARYGVRESLDELDTSRRTTEPPVLPHHSRVERRKRRTGRAHTGQWPRVLVTDGRERLSPPL